MRNPLYLGTALVAAGLAIASTSWILAAIFAAVFLAVYLPVIALEEQHLASLFPAFAAYAAEVPKLRPTFGFDSQKRPFRWDLYRRNREYQAAIGFAAAIALLLSKLLIRR